MRQWWNDWWMFLRFLLICLVIVGVFGGIVAVSVIDSKDCHQVYVQTTPVDGKPAMERSEVCR